VHNATRRSGDGQWRITVCDYFGGRGHDYRSSLDADNNGGFMVIVTTIPDSLREWVQWKGRTARQDSPGQYGVLLCSEDPNVKRAVENKIQLVADSSKGIVDEQRMKQAMDFEAEGTLNKCAKKLIEWERRHRLMVQFYQRENRTGTPILDAYKLAQAWTDKHNNVSRV
jgi:superfamily II DNA/RNA helicase